MCYLVTENINENIRNSLIKKSFFSLFLKKFFFKKAYIKRNLVCEVIVKTFFVRFHSCKNNWERKFWKTASKTDHCTLLPISNLYGGYIKGLGKETGFSNHVFCGKLDNLTQHQMDSIFYIMQAKKIDKNNIYTYISKLTLIKIIVSQPTILCN